MSISHNMDKAKELKTCLICSNKLELSNFYKKISGKFGVDSKCKTCISKLRQNYYNNNKHEIIENKQEYNFKNKNNIKKYNKSYYINNKKNILDKSKEYYNDNKDNLIIYKKGYYINNKEKIINHNSKYKRNRRKIDPLFKLNENIRSLISNTFRNNGYKKNTKSVIILGCSFQEFKDYLESKFTPEMNWQNQGSYWHMDHIKPISLAQTEQELIELNHYSNFQPLERIENIKKGNKYGK